MIKFTRLLPLLFSFVLLFCSILPVHAQTVSSGDEFSSGDFVTPQMLSLSPVSTMAAYDYGIALTNTYYAYSVPDGSKTFKYRPSYYTGVDTLSFTLFDIDLSSDPLYYEKDLFSAVFVNGLHFSGIINGMNYLGYQLWAVVGGEKYYLNNYYDSWLGFVSDDYFATTICTIGIDINFAPIVSDPSGYITANPNTTDGYLIYDNYSTRHVGGDITVSWSGFEWQLSDSYHSDTFWDKKNNSDMNNNHSSLISNLSTWFKGVYDDIALFRTQTGEWLNYIYNRIIENHNDLISNLSSWFTTLFEKMDQDQDELINGYDPDTGTSAKNEFDSSIADLESAEVNLFGQTSYDQVDYQQFNSFFSIEAVAASMLFVKNILESLFMSLGIFGIPISIGLVILVFTRLIGFQNLYGGK